MGKVARWGGANHGRFWNASKSGEIRGLEPVPNKLVSPICNLYFTVML